MFVLRTTWWTTGGTIFWTTLRMSLKKTHLLMWIIMCSWNSLFLRSSIW